MKEFLGDDFLLGTATASRLFHGHAKPMPIYDYHCHLSPREVAEDRRFENLTRLWLGGDHYKWRAMRTNGVDERLVTGDAPDEEKFLAWARTVPATIRNPLHHWTHLELRRYFGITELLDGKSARRIWAACNERLAEPGFSARGLMRRMDVRLACTTDDPVDDLSWHGKIAADTSFPVVVLPTFRPDKGLAVEDPAAFRAWLERLEQASGVRVTDFDAYLEALKRRHDFFHERGCRLSDNGLDEAYAEDWTGAQVRGLFARLLSGQALLGQDARVFKSAVLHELALLHAERDWTQQLHFGALRNNNSRLVGRLGPDTGFDSIDDRPLARSLSRFLDRLDRKERLARTILYNLNPRDNELLATMIGNFQDGSVPGKLQFGSGWWFLDQKDGMIRQLDALSSLGLLSRFVGMLTDSRSFLSYPRHEYFRRILCDLLGRDVENGEIPADLDLLGRMVRDICWENARAYFRIPLR